MITLLAAAAMTAALAQLGKAEEARRLGQDTLERSHRIHGPDHPINRLLAQIAGLGCTHTVVDVSAADMLRSIRDKSSDESLP